MSRFHGVRFFASPSVRESLPYLLEERDVAHLILVSAASRLAHTIQSEDGVVLRRRARVHHLSWRTAVRPDLEVIIDPGGIVSCELPPLGEDVAVNHCMEFWWSAPMVSEGMTFAEDAALEGTLLADDLEPEEGALRSAMFAVNGAADVGVMQMQLRWYPEGNVLCGRDRGCSLFLVALSRTAPTSVTFELRVGCLRRIFCHDFSSSPQWGCSDFGDLHCHTSDHVRLGVKILEYPARFAVRAWPDNRRAEWHILSWSDKLRFGPAAYASPPLEISCCPGTRLLVGLGPDESPELVSASPRTVCVAALPVAVFASAPTGTSMRFALQVGGHRRVFFHTFSIVAAFAGCRKLVPQAVDAVSNLRSNAVEILLEVLGSAPEGTEDRAEILPGV